MLDDVTRNNNIEALRLKRRILDGSGVNVAAHGGASYAGRDRIEFDAGNLPAQQLHDAEKPAPAATDLEEPPARLARGQQIFIAEARSCPDRWDARQD